MALTYSTCLDLAKTLLDDTSTASGITTSQWVTLFNAANRDVYRLIVGVNPSYFLAFADIVLPANTERIDLSSESYRTTTPYKIIQIEATTTAGNPTVTNTPRLLMPISFQERPQALADWFAASPGRGVTGPLWFTYEGDALLYVAPLVQTTTPLRIYYVPTLAAVSGSPNDVVLGGRAGDFHDAVAHRVAWYASVKRGGTPGIAAQLWAESQELIKSCTPSRQEGEPWRIRRVE